MGNPQRRHEVSDEAWAVMELHLSGTEDRAELLKIIVCLSMLCFGFYALNPPGAICRQDMANGEQFGYLGKIRRRLYREPSDFR